MERTIKAILIDSGNKTVTEIEVIPKLESYYKLIDCDMIEACCQDIISNNSFIYVDEEGLYKQDSEFHVKGAHQPFMGNGVLLCLSDEGEDEDINITVEHAKAFISF